MSDMISRHAAISLVHKNYDTILDFKSDGRTVADSFEDIINTLPPAQSEIIYCKNCAYRCENWISTNVDGDVIHHCTQLDQMVDDNFYCGYAERKKE